MELHKICYQFNSDSGFCSSLVSEPNLLLLSIVDIGYQMINTSEYLSYTISVEIPTFAQSYSPVSSSRIHNVGYFENRNFMKLRVPQNIVTIRDEVFTLNREQCHGNLCTLSSLSQTPETKCIKNILTSDNLAFCEIERNTLKEFCQIQETNSGTLVIAKMSEFMVFSELKHQLEPTNINFETKFIKESGSLTCGDTSTYFINKKTNSYSIGLQKFISLGNNQSQIVLNREFEHLKNFEILNNRTQNLRNEIIDNNETDITQFYLILSSFICALFFAFGFAFYFARKFALSCENLREVAFEL